MARRPQTLPVLDDRPQPFEATADVRVVRIAGQTITLRRYINRDGCQA